MRDLLRLAALLPERSAQHLRRVVPQAQIVFANTWKDLSVLLRTDCFQAALIDPQTGGDNTATAITLIYRYPRVRIVAYIEATAPNLHAVFKLSAHGLEDVFVHPVRPGDPRFLNAIEKIGGDKLASDVLAAVEPKLKALPLSVRRALVDLFHRPYRYQTASDLATEAAVPNRTLYRTLSEAEFDTPRKLMVMAKVIHGLGYARSSEVTIQQVSRKLGYESPPVFSRHVRAHFAENPSRLRSLTNSEWLVMELLERLWKPREPERLRDAQKKATARSNSVAKELSVRHNPNA